MEPRRYLSPQQVAQALGVGVSTVKRWVDDGVLPAQRTAGGHRRLLVEDVIRLVQEGNWPHVDLSLLTGLNVPLDPQQLQGPFYDALVVGDHHGSRCLLTGAHQAGVRVEVLADQVIAPVLARIGHGWEEGKLDAYHEHQGTQACLAALEGLRARLPEPGPESPLALGGGPEGDFYLLPSLLVELTLLENGWRVVNVGPNTPLTSFRRALRDVKPRLFWLSCSFLTHVEEFLVRYRELYADAVEAGVAVAVGGRALTAEVRTRMLYTAFGDGMTHLAAFARDCFPAGGKKPTAPARGAKSEDT